MTRYIKGQLEHHRKRTFKEELINLRKSTTLSTIHVTSGTDVVSHLRRSVIALVGHALTDVAIHCRSFGPVLLAVPVCL